jgi:hypothetical protein
MTETIADREAVSSTSMTCSPRTLVPAEMGGFSGANCQGPVGRAVTSSNRLEVPPASEAQPMTQPALPKSFEYSLAERIVSQGSVSRYSESSARLFELLLNCFGSGSGIDRKISIMGRPSGPRAEMSGAKRLLEARELWPLFVVYLMAIAAVVTLGADVALSSGGSGTIVSVSTVGHSGNLTNFGGAIATPNGDFIYTMTCIQLHVGDQVHYERDFLEGFQLIGALPDNCTAT